MLNPFHYRDAQLWAEDVPLSRIAAQVGTPVYVYAAGAIRGRYHALRQALDRALPAAPAPVAAAPVAAAPVAAGPVAAGPVEVAYAVKANSNLAVLRVLAHAGAGADVVSRGELLRAREAGIPSTAIVFSGVGKDDEDLDAALRAGIHQINIESAQELDRLDQRARAAGVTARVAIRVNPDIDAGTAAKITTGKADNKFGVAMDDVPALVREAAQRPGIAPRALAVHIGSQITRLEAFRDAYDRLATLYRSLRGEGLPLDTLDLGGGLAIADDGSDATSVESWVALIAEIAGRTGAKLVIEPGRWLVGPAGVLVTRVIGMKESPTRRFAIVDGAMNDLMRPALYGAHHPIWPVAGPGKGASRPMDVVGPVCESADTFARDVPLPDLAAGDLLALMTAGAYGAVMASTYNARPQVPEVLVDRSRFALVRRRRSIEEDMTLETVPEWMTTPP